MYQVKITIENLNLGDKSSLSDSHRFRSGELMVEATVQCPEYIDYITDEFGIQKSAQPNLDSAEVVDANYTLFLIDQDGGECEHIVDYEPSFGERLALQTIILNKAIYQTDINEWKEV